ncbi:NAD(P)-dependent oxidoreductase, partial [Streptomyces africanus]
DRGEWLAGFRPALADKNVLIVGYGSIGEAIEDRLVPFEVARVARVARSERTTARGPVHPLTELPALLPEADVVILSTPLTE